MLRRAGIRTPCYLSSCGDGFFVANNHPGAQDVFLDPPWTRSWYQALRSLPGARTRWSSRPEREDGWRSTFVPERYLDRRLAGLPAHLSWTDCRCAPNRNSDDF